MYSNYSPNVKATLAFLQLQNVMVNAATVNETLQNHPDWPSLLCITDSLNKWNAPNGVGKIETKNIDELPTPFIAVTNDRENALAVVKSVDENSVQVLQKNYTKPTTLKRDEFLKTWNGIYLIAEPTAQSGEHNYKANKQKAFLNTLVPLAALAAMLIFSFVLLQKNVAAFNLQGIGIYLQYFILLVGVVVTSLLLWYEIDKSNPLLQKVCTGIAKGNCNAILTGKAAKLFSWLSWSEVGFFYFTGNLLALLFVPNAINIIAGFSLLALPYTVFSIYYQWRVAKQWCVLCLAVQALLVLGGINVLSNNLLQFSAVSFSLSAFSFVLIAFSFPPLIWFTVKPYILKLQEAKNTKREYLRIKFNTQIFDTLLKKQKQITLPTDGLGIDIGNPAAANTIIKVCNPYCGPCAKAHPKIEEILEQNKNVKAKIIFTTANDEANPAVKPVRHLLAVAAENNEAKTKAALDDWYLPEKKDYEVFAEKYKMNGELKEQGNKIEAMEKWCKETGIEYTPTIFINGYQLPDAYSIEDLQYFLLA